MTLTVTNTTEVRAGFDLTVNTGTLTAVSSGTMAMGTELHHTTPQTLTSGTATWTFNWTPPTTGGGTLTFSVAGNTVNGNGSADANDHWNIATFNFTRATTSVAGFSEAGFSIYPNPAKDQFVLTAKSGNQLNISATTMTGSNVAIATNKIAADKYQINIANLVAGMYLLKLNAEGKNYTTRFVKN